MVAIEYFLGKKNVKGCFFVNKERKFNHRIKFEETLFFGAANFQKWTWFGYNPHIWVSLPILQLFSYKGFSMD